MGAGYIDELHEAFHSDLVYRPEDIPIDCSPRPKDLEQTLHGVMKLNGLVIRSLEEIAGRGANAVTYRAGKKFGHEVAKYFQKREDVEGALHELSDLLRGQYSFEPKLFSHLGNSCTPSFFSRLRTFFGTSVIWSNPS